MKRAWVLGATLLLGGCGLPPSVQIASYVFDGLSYLASDKTLTDHAISAAMDEDCALMRAIRGNHICGDDNLPTVAALADGEVIETTPAAATTTATTIAPVRKADGGVPPRRAAESETRTEATAAAEGRYLVLGSFRDPAHADRALRLYAAVAPQIAPAEIDGRQWHRVVVGPVAEPEMADARRQVAALGIDGVWPVTLCADDLGPRSYAGPAPRPIPAAEVQVAHAPDR